MPEAWGVSGSSLTCGHSSFVEVLEDEVFHLSRRIKDVVPPKLMSIVGLELVWAELYN